MDLYLLKKKNHEFWEKRFMNPAPKYRKLIERDWLSLIQRLKDNGVRDILDLGCGYGHWSIVLARAGFSVRAVDFAQSAIEILKAWAVAEGLVIPCEVNSVLAINFVSEFDAIICNSVLDHMVLDDTAMAMGNIKQALRPGGIAYVSFDGPEKEIAPYTRLDDGTRCYNNGELKNMLWRYCTDEEIRQASKDFVIISFNTRANGKRDVWLRSI